MHLPGHSISPFPQDVYGRQDSVWLGEHSRGLTCALLSAIFGRYEGTLKPITQQTRPCLMMMFSDRPDLLTDSEEKERVAVAQGLNPATTTWHVVFSAAHNRDPYVRMPTTVNTFLVAKFYKIRMWSLLPAAIQYAIWVDSTVRITHPHFVSRVLGTMEEKSVLFVAPPLWSRSWWGEVELSYTKYHIFLKRYHALVAFALYAIQQGFCELACDASLPAGRERQLGMLLRNCTFPSAAQLAETVAVALQRCAESKKRAAAMNVATAALETSYFAWTLHGLRSDFLQQYLNINRNDATLERRNQTAEGRMMPSVLWTAFFAVRRSPKTELMMDDWWVHTYQHWQDQVSLPFILWKRRVVPALLYDLEAFYQQHPHGH